MRKLADNLMVFVIIVLGVIISLVILGPNLIPQDISKDNTQETIQVEISEASVKPFTEYAVAHADSTEINYMKISYTEQESVEEVQIEEINEPDKTEEMPKQEEVEEDNEFRTRCKMTYAEAGLEDVEGQIAVAAVILNRQNSSKFPDTLEGVITQSGAFSSVRNGEVYIMTANPYVLEYEDIPERTIEATQRALNGEDPTEQLLWEEAVRLGLDPEEYAAGGALFFYNPNACSDEALQQRANIQCKVQIGNHIFYKVWG